ncbi:hypothetical protein ACHAXR_005208 [Thalassiosira sp. AJA248-18]
MVCDESSSSPASFGCSGAQATSANGFVAQPPTPPPTRPLTRAPTPAPTPQSPSCGGFYFFGFCFF